MARPALACVAFCAFQAATVLAQPLADSCDNCGTVQSVREVTEQAANWRPLGTVAPGSMSGDMGQPDRTTTSLSIGKGGANQGVVVLGAAGGAAYQKQSKTYARPRWEVVVRMDRGEPRTVPTSYDPLVQEGDRVRVYGTQLELIPKR